MNFPTIPRASSTEWLFQPSSNDESVCKLQILVVTHWQFLDFKIYIMTLANLLLHLWEEGRQENLLEHAAGQKCK